MTVLPRLRAASLTRALALVAVGLTALTACTSGDSTVPAAGSTSASATPTEVPVEPVAWDDCTAQIAPIIAGRAGADRPLTFSCGTVDVPLDHDDPTGPTLPLFAVRAVSGTQTDRIGSLVVNPGGPGLSATDAAVQSALTLPDAVLARFDVVGVDPRGVGLSQPVECISDAQKDTLTAAEPRPTTADQLDTAFDLADDVGAGCADTYGEALGSFSTVDSAYDLDVVRQALGDTQLTYLGYSYGTTLGSTYAELFPAQVRALVLDGAVDPDADREETAEAQAAGFEQAFDAFAANCVALVGGCPVGADPRTFVGDLLTQAAATPVPSTRVGETRQATPGLVLAAVRSALYTPAAWPQLAQSLASAQAGDSAGVLTLADTFTGRSDDGTYTNTIDANTTISCSDTDETHDQDEVRALVTEWDTRYPLFGADAALGLYTCTPWEAPRTPLPDRDAEGAAPILVVGTQGDPVSPLPGAVDLAADLTSGVLLTWQGAGHTAYPQTACVTDAVNSYLIDLVAPLDGLTCPA